MINLAGEDHAYEMFDDAKRELTQALETSPANPQIWFAGFQTKYRGLLNDDGWMNTGLILPKGISGDSQPTLGSLIAEVREKLRI